MGGEALQTALRLYEKQLLDATGFGLILDREAGSDTALDPKACYDYQPDRGPVRVAESARERDGLVAGRALLALDAGHVDPADWPALRQLMRRVLKRQLGERPLASEALFRALRKRREGSEPASARTGIDTGADTSGNSGIDIGTDTGINTGNDSGIESNQDPARVPAGNKEPHHG